MNKHLRNLLTFLALLAFFAVIRFPYNEYAEDFFRQQKEEARKQGLFLDAGKVDLQFPAKISLRDLKLILPLRPWPVPLTADVAEIRPQILTLIRMMLGWGASLNLYGGDLEISFEQLNRKPEVQITAHGKSIDLSKHQILGPVGISGILSLDIEGDVAANIPGGKDARQHQPPFIVNHGKASLNIEQGRYAGGAKISGLVPIPEISAITLNAKATAEGDRITVT